MSGLPGTPQAPAAPTSADPPPPTITVEDIMGGGAAAVRAAATPTGASPPVVSTSTPAAGDQNLAELTKFFGVEVPAGQDATAALKPIINMLAQGGMNQANQDNQANRYGQVTPTEVPAAPAPAAPVVPGVSLEGVDLSDADPAIAKAFKALAARSDEAITAANKNTALAMQATNQVQKQFHEQAANSQRTSEQQVETRAVGYLDGLASPKYGVGSNRTMVQTMAAEQVMRTAGHLIRGMQSYGQVMPIEQVMNAAILAVDGSMPAAPAPYQAPTPALAPQTPMGVAPPVTTRGVGSTGSAGAMMSDPEFMDGARAILAR